MTTHNQQPAVPNWIGSRVDQYEILSWIGRGGMGEVFLAHDHQLKRNVAVKLLSEALGLDAERVARFQREAQILATLNHPHIAAIYDVASSGTSRFLVLELIEGQTLADRIAQGPLEIDEASNIARQIADALEAAHERGIVHRDLKPANVKVSSENFVKVLDFGLAKARQSQTASDVPTETPTFVSASVPGTILGTPAYMSPERIRGQQADSAEDVWAFGCVLYEMLAGQRVFPGETVPETLAAVLKSDPDWSRLPAHTPESIRRLLRRCLQKDRRYRLRNIADARLEIDEAQNQSEVLASAQSLPKATPRTAWTISAIATLIAVTSLAFWWFAPSAASPAEARLEITTTDTPDPRSTAISPDGKKLLYVAQHENRSLLWLRPLSSASAQPLSGTENATLPFWSPDSRHAGFFAGGKLKHVDTESGTVQTLTAAPDARGGTWGEADVIVFAPSPSGPLLRISATGGQAQPATRMAEQHLNHRWPRFLPGGRRFLYFVQGPTGIAGLYVGEIDKTDGTRLLDIGESRVSYMSSGHLVFARDGALFAQPFDVSRLALSGNTLPIAVPPDGQAIGGASVSDTNVIVYRPASASGGSPRQLVWFDRSGTEIRKVGGQTNAVSLALSPDEKVAAMRLTTSQGIDIWLLDIERDVLTRFTFDPAIDMWPAWSPDGTRIAFTSARTGVYDMYWKAVAGDGREEAVLQPTASRIPMDWSSDNEFLLYSSTDPVKGSDLFVVNLKGDRVVTPVAKTSYDERFGQFSPDTKWIAFQSDESGDPNIYIQPFSTSGTAEGTKVRISRDGGTQPRWRRDGQELFYISPDHQLMAVRLRFGPQPKDLKVEAPTALFRMSVGGAYQAVPTWEYSVSRDGKRFLVNTAAPEPTRPITVILNWKPGSEFEGR